MARGEEDDQESTAVVPGEYLCCAGSVGAFLFHPLNVDPWGCKWRKRKRKEKEKKRPMADGQEGGGVRLCQVQQDTQVARLRY